MVEDLPQPALASTTSDIELTVQQAMMHMIMEGIGKINNCMAHFEERLQNMEKPKPANGPPPEAPCPAVAAKDP